MIVIGAWLVGSQIRTQGWSGVSVDYKITCTRCLMFLFFCTLSLLII